MTSTCDPSIFRAYDIRGIHPTQIDAATMNSIGRAIAEMTRLAGDTQLIVGRDGRTHGEELQQAFMEGVSAGGVDVIDIGVVPSPVVYWAATNDCQVGQNSGVVVTASHNPPEYSGLKVVIKGKTLAGDGIQEIYRTATQSSSTPAASAGTITSHDVKPDYIATICTRFSDFSGDLTFALDPAHGALGPLAVQIFDKLNANIVSINDTIDGTFPAHPADPTERANMEQLQQLVNTHSAALGLGFDGDGDRVGCIDARGRFISADVVLLWLAHQRQNESEGRKVVFDVKSTSLLDKLLPNLGLEPLMVRTGHSYIKAAIAEHNPWIAGEMSGHCFFPQEWYPFDDAMFAGLAIAKTQECADVDLAHFIDTLPNLFLSPELKIPLPASENGMALVEVIRDNFPASEKATMSSIDGMRYQDDNGFVCLRPSNTSPVLTVRIEGVDSTRHTIVCAVNFAKLSCRFRARWIRAWSTQSWIRHPVPCTTARCAGREDRL